MSVNERPACVYGSLGRAGDLTVRVAATAKIISAEKAEGVLRRLEAPSLGKFTDLIVLDRDIFTCNVYDIGDTEVLLTLLGGKEVYRADNFLN